MCRDKVICYLHHVLSFRLSFEFFWRIPPPPCHFPYRHITPSAISLPTFSTLVIEVTRPIRFVHKTDDFRLTEFVYFRYFCFHRYIIYIIKAFKKKKSQRKYLRSRDVSNHFFFFLVNTVFSRLSPVSALPRRSSGSHTQCRIKVSSVHVHTDGLHKASRILLINNSIIFSAEKRQRILNYFGKLLCSVRTRTEYYSARASVRFPLFDCAP